MFLKQMKKYYNKSNELLPSIDTLFIPDDFFKSNNLGDSSTEWFLKYCDKDEVKKYEYYIKCIKNRTRYYLKTWVRNGYPLVDLLFSGLFHNYGCRNDMEQLLYESMLGKHYLS